MKKISLTALIITISLSFVLSFGVNGVFAADKDKYGGTLVFNHSKTADIIGDPLLIRGWNHEFVDFVLQPLLRASNVNLGTIEPNLATEWTLAADKSHYIFKLRKGVKFHDGTDFNAQAAKWNLERFTSSKQAALDSVTSIEVIDDYTLKVNTSGWNAVFILDFTKGTFMISPTAFEKNGAEWAKHNPVGTGAFKVIDYKRNTHIKYEKHDDYWKEGLPYIDKVTATQIADPMTALASLKGGSIDAWLGADSVSAGQIRDSGGFDVVTTKAVHHTIQYNSEDPNSIWSKKKARQALEYALNKEAIAKALGRGFLFPVYEVIHSINEQEPGPGTTPRKYDPEKAKQLLKEAGVPEGIKIKFTYNATAATTKDEVQAMQGLLAEVGIQVVPNPLIGAVMNQILYEPAPPNMLLMNGQRGGPGEFLSAIDESFGEGAVYFKGVAKPEGFSDLLKTAMKTVDPKERLEMVFGLERLAYEDCMLVALNGELFATLQNPKVQDAVWFWAGQPFPYIDEAWIKK